MPNTNVSRRQLLQATGGAAAVGLAGCMGDAGGNDDFPSGEMTHIVTYGPGGGYDTYARLVNPYLEDELDTTITIQNIEGGDGQVGTVEVYTADPDGHTFGIINVEQMATQQTIEDEDYDLGEMTWYATAAEDITAISVAPDRGVESWEDYINLVQDGELNFGHQGLTSSSALGPILAGELGGDYKADRVVDNSVVYDGRGDMIPGLERGDIDIMAGTYESILPYHESGDVEIFMVLITDDEPPEQTPDAQTLADVDVDDPEGIQNTVSSIRSFAGPPDVPDEEAGIIADAFQQALNNDELLAEAEEADRPINYASASETTEIVQNSLDSWEENQDLLEELVQDG